MNMPETGTGAALPVAVILPEVSRDRLSWTGGIHLANQNVALTRTYTFLPGPYTSSYDYQTRSLFGEISLPVSARMQVVAGARFERRSQSFSDSESVQFRPEDSLWSGRLGIQWNLAAETMAYLSISRGVKSGASTPTARCPLASSFRSRITDRGREWASRQARR